MKSRYSQTEARQAIDRYAGQCGEDLALRVYTSRLLGADASLVLHGGGNTSVKSQATEISGEPVEVLYVKGSGWDLGSIEPAGFPACRLAPLRRYAALPEMTDEQMVSALRSQMLDPRSPTPSVEALLHALMPAKFVDHTHADAVLSVVDQPDGAERARDVWPDGLLFVPYVMPGFLLARQIAELGEALASATVLVLDKHGIFTWGQTASESYERMIEAVSRAEDYVATERGPISLPRAMPREQRQLSQRRLAPLIRGALGRAVDGNRLVAEWRDEAEILRLLSRPDAVTVTRIGTVTPDHVIRTKPFPVWLDPDPSDEATARRSIEEALSQYATWYEAYFEQNANRHREPLTRLDRLPRLVAVPGLGVLALGKTLKEARTAGDIYTHTAKVIDAAASMSGYQPVSHADLFDVEYWSLEQAKLKIVGTSAGALSRHIAVVTGAAQGIGRATAERLLGLGAHVVLSDIDAELLEGTRQELSERYGLQVHACAGDVTREADVERLMDAAVDTFGGLDIVVSNAGDAPGGLLHTRAGHDGLLKSLDLNFLSHQRVARAAAERLLAQDLGGCLLFNASKSAFNPGAEFGPYAIPKAAVVALMRQYAIDLGAHGIRANAINADRIQTALFSPALVEARAKARGVSKDAYFKQNLLGRETTAVDVADAFAFLATAHATTGCVLTVDGGNAAAFPR